MTKLYPKGTIRRIVKAHEPNHKLSKSADVLVRFPSCLSFPVLLAIPIASLLRRLPYSSACV